jgi:hypothetical protein
LSGRIKPSLHNEGAVPVSGGAEKGAFRMNVQRTRHVTPAFVVAMIALFVALGGTAGAVATQAVPLAKRALTADNAKKLGGKTSAQIVSQATKAAQTAAQAPGPASTAAGLVTTVSQTFGSLAPGQEAEVLVVCATGKKVLGGGFSSDGAVFSFDSHPANDTTWRMYLANGDQAQAAPNVRVYAVCIG